MSLIHTCELEGVDPFDYLTALHRHAEALAANPTAWMPWNYRESLTQLEATVPAASAPPLDAATGSAFKAGVSSSRMTSVHTV